MIITLKLPKKLANIIPHGMFLLKVLYLLKIPIKIFKIKPLTHFMIVNIWINKIMNL